MLMESFLEHQTDVSDCLTSFRGVSENLRSCREQIKNVKNVLGTCKSLLQCRRDDLKKLWAETAEQKYLSKILQDIDGIKHIDKKMEKLMSNGQYCDAVDCLKQADILLSGPLSAIDGLTQLRINISDNIQSFFEKIVNDLLLCIVSIPFECEIIELMKGLNETTLRESQVCVKLLNKYSLLNLTTLPIKPIVFSMVSQWSNRNSIDDEAQFEPSFGSASQEMDLTEEKMKKKITECLEALKVFDQLDSAIENIFTKTPSLCLNAVNDLITVLRLFLQNNDGDSTHFAQLCQLMIHQITDCSNRFCVLIDELRRARPDSSTKALAVRFWNILQNALETVVSYHLDIWQPVNGDKRRDERRKKTKALFSFENTSFVVTANTSLNKQCNLICAQNPYNISAVFYILNRFATKVEQELKNENEVCKFNTFLHSFVMDTFIEHVRDDLETKTEQILKGTEVWSSIYSLTTNNVKILTSCVRIFELCEMVNDFIKQMGSYTQRFAALWLLIIAAYTKSASDMYSQIIRARNHQGDNFVEYPKISAGWAVDEDISRLLKSLPTWTSIRQCSQQQSSSATNETIEHTLIEASLNGLNEDDSDIYQRNQRESEILIGNLGAQKHIQRIELITDMDHIKSLVCIHESLQWFASSMRAIIKRLPDRLQEILKCRIQISDGDSGEMVEQLLSDALEERLTTLDGMAETCLLMIYLEIRIHCFYHLLPLTQFRSESQEDQDLEINEFGRDLMQFHQTLSVYIVSRKLKYLFSGLGHLCASIFIHSSQYINKLSDQDRKRICRNIFTVQKCLSQLSGKPELEINRALTFYKLVNMEIDQIFALIKESGESYTYLEHTYLLSLAVRSHPVLNSQPGALETILSQLRDNLSK